MGQLLERETGVVVHLNSRNVIGRGRSCAVRLQDSAISAEHAVLFWRDGWHVRDLGSRNGTRVNDEAIEPGDACRVVEGDALTFGDVAGFVLVDGSAPGPVGVALEGGSVVHGTEQVLLLPEDEPLCTVYAHNEGWWVDDGDQVRPVDDGDVVAVGDRRWRVWVPSALGTTTRSNPPTPEAIALHFRASLDEEHVDVRMVHGSDETLLEPRAYHYLLLTLARRRLADRERGTPEEDAGWIHIDDLARLLREDRRTVNVHIGRIRQQLSSVGVVNAGSAVERRNYTGQLRIGVAQLDVRRGGGSGLEQAQE